MGVVSRCGCKEVYRFPHTTYPYSSCICYFLQQHSYFCSFLNVFRSCVSIHVSHVYTGTDISTRAESVIHGIGPIAD